jgi:hypothetical protein
MIINIVIMGIWYAIIKALHKRKIGTLGVHASAQRNSMVAKISFTIISKHLYFEVTIQPAAGYLVDCWLYSDYKKKS